MGLGGGRRTLCQATLGGFPTFTVYYFLSSGLKAMHPQLMLVARGLHPTHSRTGAIVMFSLYASLRGAVLGGTAQWVKYLPIRPTV